jgi:hypothetical protein
MVSFQTKNPNLEGLGMELVVTYSGHFGMFYYKWANFMGIW